MKFGSFICILILGIYSSVFSQQVEISFPDTSASYGDEIIIPIIAKNISENDSIISYQFTVAYNNEALKSLGATTNGTISASWGIPFINNNESGKIIVGSYNEYPLLNEGVLLYLRFKVIKTVITDTSLMEITSFIFNNNSPEVIIQNGLFTIYIDKVNVQFLSNNGFTPNILIESVEKKIPFDTLLIKNAEYSLDVESPQSFEADIQYVFEGWSDGGDKNHNIVAYTDTTFSILMQKQYFITVSSTPAGIIDSLNSNWYNENESTIFEALDIVQYNAENYKFISWMIDGNVASGANILDVVVSNSYNITAQYGSLYEISGKIGFIDDNLSNVKLMLSNGLEDTTLSNNEGSYTFPCYESGDFTITPLLHGFKFIPESIDVLSLNENVIEQNFMAFDTLAPSVKVLYPNGGEKLLKSSQDTIKWLASDNSSIEYLNLHYSMDDGKTWKLFFGGMLDECKYVWAIPDSLSNSIKVKVTVADKVGNISFDESDSSFSIVDETSVENKLFNTPLIFKLYSNYPNPFNNSTIIPFQVVEKANIEIQIFNISGQKIITLTNQQFEAGYHNILWDGRDIYGDYVSSGIYFYQLKSGKLLETKSLLFLK